MSGPGCGRGGRGAALLQALNKPVRKPGTTPASAETTSVSVLYCLKKFKFFSAILHSCMKYI